MRKCLKTHLNGIRNGLKMEWTINGIVSLICIAIALMLLNDDNNNNGGTLSY